VKYDYGQFSPEHLEKMQEGVELFNEQKYWECHESLEDVWMEDRGDLARNVYWAVIQVAAACIHYRDSKIVGAQGMIVKAKEKFLRCREKLILTPLAFDYLDWEELEELVMEIPAKDAKLEDFAKLYEFRFKNYKNILSN
jgi:hypothetical protein